MAIKLKIINGNYSTEVNGDKFINVTINNYDNNKKERTMKNNYFKQKEGVIIWQ